MAYGSGVTRGLGRGTPRGSALFFPANVGSYARGSRLAAYGSSLVPGTPAFGSPTQATPASSRIANAYGLSAYKRGAPQMGGYARPWRLGAPAQQGGPNPASYTPVGIAADIIGKIAGSLIHTDNNDPKRLAQNAAWLNAALQGDRMALANLYTASGVGPPSPESPNVPYTAGKTTGTIAGGWATATATADAANKYNQATQALSPAGGQSSLLPQTQNSILPIAITPQVIQPTVQLPNTNGITDTLTALLNSFASTPGGQSVIQSATPAVVAAGKQQAGATIGAAIVNNPTVVAGLIIGGLALAATLGRRGGR